VEDETAQVFLLRWHWPEERFTDRCLVTLSPEEPTARDDPDTMATLTTMIVEREPYMANGEHLRLPVQPDWLGAHVAVWALVDLGFEVLQGPPVALGRIRVPSKWGLASWSVFAGRGAEAAPEQGDKNGAAKWGQAGP
ncbi:MAG: hypothetical protein U1E05_08960, partial [Patescibacteria group bacterium]|nr:hypothetical protein [Patescibacteria group bacterium]